MCLFPQSAPFSEHQVSLVKETARKMPSTVPRKACQLVILYYRDNEGAPFISLDRRIHAYEVCVHAPMSRPISSQRKT